MILNNKTLCHFLLSNYACREYTKSVSHPFLNTRWKYNSLNSISTVYIQNLVICFYVFTFKWRHWFLFRHSFSIFLLEFLSYQFPNRTQLHMIVTYELQFPSSITIFMDEEPWLLMRRSLSFIGWSLSQGSAQVWALNSPRAVPGRTILRSARRSSVRVARSWTDGTSLLPIFRQGSHIRRDDDEEGPRGTTNI